MATYLVTRDGAAEGEKPKMVEARNQAAAIAFVARGMFAANAISTKEAVEWSKNGVDLEDASVKSEAAE